MLERFGHGGDLRTAEETFGRPMGEFLDFSSNMNPLGPPSAVEQIMKTAWRDIVHYPDPAVRELRGRLALKYGIEPDSILVGNGAAELIDLAARELRAQSVGIARPSFTEYEEAVLKSGGAVRSIPLRPAQQFTLQEADLAEASAACDLLFLGHPNNPTGRLLPKAVLDMLAAGKQRAIVDEAFIDFIPDENSYSLLKQAAVSKHLFVIRSMTKFYSIPGIRLGFMVAHPDWIRKLRALQVQWSVNYLAQRLGAAVLEDTAYEQSSRRWLQTENPWLTQQLRLLGLEVAPSDVNYVLFAFPEASGIDVKQAQLELGRQGLLIRDASLFEGLNRRYARVAVKLREHNERLVRALAELIRRLDARNGGAADE